MIEQITIKNYKSIRDMDSLPLHRINVLIGENGAGKSNFISFFEMINAIYNQRFAQYILQRGGIDRFLNSHSDGKDRIHCLLDFDNVNAISMDIVSSISGKGIIANTSHYFNGINDKTKNYDSWHDITIDSNVEESNIQLYNSARIKHLKRHLSSFKVYHFSDTSLTSPMRKQCSIGDNEMLRHDASNLAAWLYRLQHTDETSFSLIEATVRSIAPYFRKFRLNPDALNSELVKLEWEEEESDRYFDAYAFSDGTIRFIALAALLLSKHKPAVILIDEPELGLHPAAMTKLAAMIRMASKDSQVVVSTQSAAFIDEFDADDVIVVERKGDGSTFRRLDSSKLDAWHTDYSLGELWRKNVIGGKP